MSEQIQERWCRICGEQLTLVSVRQAHDGSADQGTWECHRCGHHTQVGPLIRGARVNPMLGAGQRVVPWV